MLLVQHGSLDLLTSSPARCNCTMDVPSDPSHTSLFHVLTQVGQNAMCSHASSSFLFLAVTEMPCDNPRKYAKCFRSLQCLKIKERNLHLSLWYFKSLCLCSATFQLDLVLLQPIQGHRIGQGSIPPVPRTVDRGFVC